MAWEKSSYYMGVRLGRQCREQVISTGLKEISSICRTRTQEHEICHGTSTAGWTAEKDCDYLCDGTADQTK